MWKILQNLINSKIFLYCVIGGLVWFWITDRSELRQNIHRLENNQIALTTQQSIQQQVTVGEFKKLHSKEDSIAKLVGLKPNQIQNVIVNNYHYKDTTIVEVPLQPKDSLSRDTLSFVAPINCMQVKGEVINNKKVRILDVELNDKLHTFVYKKYNNKFLFIKWNKYYDVITYSECMKKNINVEQNIKIIK
jgi:hypothetical protein